MSMKNSFFQPVSINNISDDEYSLSKHDGTLIKTGKKVSSDGDALEI